MTQIIVAGQNIEIRMPTKEQTALHDEIMGKWKEQCSAMNKIFPFYDATNNTASFLTWLIGEGYIGMELQQ